MRLLGSVVKALGLVVIALVSAACQPHEQADRAAIQSVNTTPAIGSFVLYAERSVTLGSNAAVLGNIAVAIPAVSTPGPQLAIGDRAVVQDLYSPSTSIGDNGVVSGVATNVLEVGAHVDVGASVAFPATTMPVLPLAVGSPGSGGSITISQPTSLSPGVYGDIDDQSVLALSAGTYTFASLTMEPHSVLSSNGAVEVQVSGTLSLQEKVVVESPDAQALRFDVSASDPPSSQAVTIGSSTVFHGLLSVPHGTISFADHVQATGAFAASDITIGNECSFTLEEGFPLTSPGELGSQQLSGYAGVQSDASFPLIGPVSSDQILTLDIGLPVTNSVALNSLASQLADPTSPMYRQYITPAQFKVAYGASDADYASLQSWAVQAGFTIVHTFDNNLLLSVTGTAFSIEQAFHVNLVYRQTSDGFNLFPFVAVDREPSINLTPTLLWVSGFDNWVPVRPRASGCKQFPTHCCDTSSDCGGVVVGQTLQVGSCLTNISGVGACAGSGYVGVCGIGQTTDSGIGSASNTDTGTLMAPDLRAAYLGVGTMCANQLDGTGQTVGIVSFSSFSSTDVAGYMSAQTTATGLTCSPACGAGDVCFEGQCASPVQQVATVNVNGPDTNNDEETTLDIDMVLAMAPRAQIIVYVGTEGVNSNFDSVFATMANDNRITVATNSWDTGRSANAAQSLLQMAVQGVSFFDASGDNGDIGDPQDSTDMPYQTLVGGTVLDVGQVTFGPPPIYSAPYRVGETTWNQGCPGYSGNGFPFDIGGLPSGGDNDITGGGYMNASQTGDFCECFPEPFCCGAAVGAPGYQQDPSLFTDINYVDPASGGNGASPVYRNYPDVSAVALGVATYNQGKLFPINGTSVAAPVWAGFTALANQFAHNNLANSVGFANPVLYLIGLTRGMPGTQDLYSTSFNDIHDGIFNSDTLDIQTQQILGFPSVVGYDLATGWGSPTCGLIEQLGTSSPTAPQTYSFVYFHLDNGHDGLNDQTSLTAQLLDTSGNPLTELAPGGAFTLKQQGANGWSQIGVAHDIGPLALTRSVNPFEIGGVSLQMHENGQSGIDADNWDIAGIGVTLSPEIQGQPALCIASLAPGDMCDSQEPSCSNGSLPGGGNGGVARLSETAGSSGQGPNVSFFINPASSSASGCFPTLGPGSAQPFDEIQIRIATSDDNLDTNSELDYQIIGKDSNGNPFLIPGASGVLHQPGDPGLDDQTETILQIPGYQLGYNDIAGILVTFTPNQNCVGPICTTDSWNVEDVDYWGVHASRPWEFTSLSIGCPGTNLNGSLSYFAQFSSSNTVQTWNATFCGQ